MTPTTLDIAGAPGTLMLGQWQSATLARSIVWYRNTLESDRFRLFFYEGSLLMHRYGLGRAIDHATICDLFTLVFGFWFSAQSPTDGKLSGQMSLRTLQSKLQEPQT